MSSWESSHALKYPQNSQCFLIRMCEEFISELRLKLEIDSWTSIQVCEWFIDAWLSFIEEFISMGTNCFSFEECLSNLTWLIGYLYGKWKLWWKMGFMFLGIAQCGVINFILLRITLKGALSDGFCSNGLEDLNAMSLSIVRNLMWN